MLIISILIIGLRTDRNFLQAQEEMVTVKPERPKALLFRNETRLLHSDAIGQDFEIHISFPVDYFRTPTADPEHDKTWQKTLRRMSGREDIVVSSGGAAQFLAFIRNEVIPYIEANYRVSKTDRAIMGYSLGGLFTLYALFHAPETFRRYFAGSPSLWWGNGVLFRDEQNFAEAHTDLPVKLFLSAGALEDEEMIADVKRMETLLRSRNYPNLDLQSHVFEDETHQSAYPAATSRA
ncbi:MAG: alpha/beta hydrolase-fold protein, partial [Calditrichia bacterium]